MFDPNAEPSERARLLAKAVARWDTEGGAGEGGREYPVSGAPLASALPLTNAELFHRRAPRFGPLNTNESTP
jgi:hypothetical protein